MAQAKSDFLWAEDALKGDHFVQTCFSCQQVAEKAIKALAFFRGIEMVKSHSVLRIANELGVNGEIEVAAKKLDLYYVSARYPDAFPEGAPYQYFTRPQAEEALLLAKVVLDRVSAEVEGI